MKSFTGYANDLKANLEKLEIYYQNQPDYPGEAVVKRGKKLLTEVLQFKYSNEFFTGIDAKREDYLDFADEFDPVKKFFAGDQLSIFDRAIKLMKIYDDSKTFIVNADIEAAVVAIKAIMKAQSPYGQIFKLPELLDGFVKLYGTLLIEMQKPVMAAIEEARKRVFDELQNKKCQDKLADKFRDRFKEINDKAEHCNNVATLQNIKVEADALKVRLLNEIASEEAKMEPPVQPVAQPDNPDAQAALQPAPMPKVKKQKTISIKSVTVESTWQLETPEDVKHYIASLENKLMKTLEEDTVINIEF